MPGRIWRIPEIQQSPQSIPVSGQWNACDRMGTGCHCTMDTGTETGPYSKKPGRDSGTDKPDDRRGIQGDASECKENRRASKRRKFPEKDNR